MTKLTNIYHDGTNANIPAIERGARLAINMMLQPEWREIKVFHPTCNDLEKRGGLFSQLGHEDPHEGYKAFGTSYEAVHSRYASIVLELAYLQRLLAIEANDAKKHEQAEDIFRIVDTERKKIGLDVEGDKASSILMTDMSFKVTAIYTGNQLGHSVPSQEIFENILFLEGCHFPLPNSSWDFRGDMGALGLDLDQTYETLREDRFNILTKAANWLSNYALRMRQNPSLLSQGSEYREGKYQPHKLFNEDNVRLLQLQIIQKLIDMDVQNVMGLQGVNLEHHGSQSLSNIVGRIMDTNEKRKPAVRADRLGFDLVD